jgi:hypothetical protein
MKKMFCCFPHSRNFPNRRVDPLKVHVGHKNRGDCKMYPHYMTENSPCQQIFCEQQRKHGKYPKKFFVFP